MVPSDVEELDHPRAVLVQLARQSRSKKVRTDIVPDRGVSGRVGRAYLPRIVEFVTEFWDPDSASRKCRSLASCRRVLAEWARDT
jgi:hypothetical protein